MHARSSMFVLCGALVMAGCGDDGGGDDGSAVDAGGDASADLCTAQSVPCPDDVILDLGLQADKISEGIITNTEVDGDIVSLVDATAGGFGNSAMNPYIYMKFTKSGLTKVDIDDEIALTSMDWDIAAKRFVVRLNGGVSGPSCVAAAMLTGQSYADVTAVPQGTQFGTDSFYDSQCTYVDDGLGIGGPNVALNGWWEYPQGCVATTGTPAVIQLADGQTLRFTIESYYGTGQAECNATGTPGTDAAMLTFRWKLLE